MQRKKILYLIFIFYLSTLMVLWDAFNHFFCTTNVQEIFIRVQCQFSVHFKCQTAATVAKRVWPLEKGVGKPRSQEERRSKCQGKEKHPDSKAHVNSDTQASWHPDTLTPWHSDALTLWHSENLTSWCQGRKCANLVPDPSHQGHQTWEAKKVIYC